MKTTIAALVAIAGAANANLILTGIIDGPLSGGVPKAIELYATTNIADLSIYGIESANNGNPAAGVEFSLSGSASAGEYIYIASESVGFSDFFGFGPNFTTSVLLINGDDAMVLYENGVAIDAYGVVGEDGTGTAWDHVDSWAYRLDNTGPSSMFNVADWTVAPTDSLDGLTSNSSGVVPFGTYVPAPGAAALVAMGGIAAIRRRR